MIALFIAALLLCVIGFTYKSKIIQDFRPFILLVSLVYFGFINGGCPCVLSYFQGFILFLTGKTSIWLGFVVVVTLLALSVLFGSIWCGWLCWLGALQEFLFQKTRLRLLKTKKAQTILFYIQTGIFAILVFWIILMQRPVLCAYDPFLSIFKLKILTKPNWIGYITVPLLLLSSLLIYRPFCRIVCPVGWLLYIVKFIPFARKMKITECTGCQRCHKYCKMDAIHGKEIEKTCTFCGECKKAECRTIKRN